LRKRNKAGNRKRRLKLKDVVIASGVRTPIGRYGGALRDVQAYKLGSLVLEEVVKRVDIDPAYVDDVIMAQLRFQG
jgi:acetyl-CoA C-acetyltransferase